jgi:outer membrane protein OmpA-like peptidoglycan-associated protein
MMLFTSDRPGAGNGRGGERIWIAGREGGDWGAPMPAGDALGMAEHAGGATLTPDGNYMIFAAYQWSEGETSGRTDLFSAEKVNGEWGHVRSLGPVVNSSGWDSQPSLSSDGRALFFSSDRPGGLGGADIWVTRLVNGQWTAPVNLGAPVNTSANELTPSIAPDDRSLFFSSNGHGGAGGYDIFVVTGGDRSGNGWRGVENMGSPINSSADEHCFISLPNSRHGFFSSNRDGDFDLYKADPNPRPAEALVTVAGRVLDERTKLPVAAQVTITDLSTGQSIATFRSDDRTGDYYVVLLRGRRYSITAEAENYIFYSDEYQVASTSAAKDLRKDIELAQTDGGMTRLLVFFDYDKSDLKDESLPDLRRATAFLRENPGVAVEISGHTDSLGTASYNRKLSQERADAVRRYFTRQGIDGGRITARGYGEERPVGDNGDEESRARNRRVEMRVTTGRAGM